MLCSVLLFAGFINVQAQDRNGSTGNPVPADIPVGVTKEFTFAESAIFPGTTRVGNLCG